MLHCRLQIGENVSFLEQWSLIGVCEIGHGVCTRARAIYDVSAYSLFVCLLAALGHTNPTPSLLTLAGSIPWEDQYLSRTFVPLSANWSGRRSTGANRHRFGAAPVKATLMTVGTCLVEFRENLGEYGAVVSYSQASRTCYPRISSFSSNGTRDKTVLLSTVRQSFFIQ